MVLLTGILYGFGMILKCIGNGNVIWFCNYNHNQGCPEYWDRYWLRKYYTVLVLIEVFVTFFNFSNFSSFGNDNSKRRMSCSCIGIGLVAGMLYVSVRI